MMAPKKRKADEISEGYDDVVRHLPAPVWGNVLDYMQYGEVRSALLVGKQIASEAVKHVRVLSVMKASEMHVPAARRFANVEEINVLGFIQGPEQFGLGEDDPCEASADVANRSASFISAFPKLSRAFIGGEVLRDGAIVRVTHRDEDIYDNVGPENHEEIFRSLAQSICGAFKTAVLSQNVKIEGVVGVNMQLPRACFDDFKRQTPCDLCRDIVHFYPLRVLLDASWPPDCYCLRDVKFWKIIRDRPGGRQALITNSAKFLMRWLRRENGMLKVKKVPLPSHIQGQRDAQAKLIVRMVGAKRFEELDAFIALGFDPKLITKKEFSDFFSEDIGETNFGNSRRYTYWLRSTVEKLAARGFPVDCDSIPVIDNEFTCYGYT